uniref:Uncharacterized protein n=1 Tax=Rhizophora mucronata TaxID=61149 RepID=A0A2P2Q3F9_RHIMU
MSKHNYIMIHGILLSTFYLSMMPTAFTPYQEIPGIYYFFNNYISYDASSESQIS